MWARSAGDSTAARASTSGGMKVSSPPPGLRPHLHHAGRFQPVHGLERFGHALSHRQQAMVAQDQVLAGAQVAHQARLFLGIERQAFVVVICQRTQRDEGELRQRQQAVLLRRHRHSVDGMRVQDAHGVLAGRVDTAVDGEARRIDVVCRVHHLAPVQVDLDQAGRGDLVKHHAVGVDEEMLGAGHLGRDVGEDQVIPAEQRHQPVERRQILAHLPFRFADLLAHAGGQRSCRIHVSSPFFDVCPRREARAPSRTVFGLHALGSARAASVRCMQQRGATTPPRDLPAEKPDYNSVKIQESRQRGPAPAARDDETK